MSFQAISHQQSPLKDFNKAIFCLNRTFIPILFLFKCIFRPVDFHFLTYSPLSPLSPPFLPNFTVYPPVNIISPTHSIGNLISITCPQHWLKSPYSSLSSSLPLFHRHLMSGTVIHVLWTAMSPTWQLVAMSSHHTLVSLIAGVQGRHRHVDHYQTTHNALIISIPCQNVIHRNVG